jgi:hypothetical protein
MRRVRTDSYPRPDHICADGLINRSLRFAVARDGVTQLCHRCETLFIYVRAKSRYDPHRTPEVGGGGGMSHF